MKNVWNEIKGIAFRIVLMESVAKCFHVVRFKNDKN